MLHGAITTTVSVFDYRVATGPLAEITQRLLQTNLISHDAMWEMSRCDSAETPTKTGMSVEHKLLG